MLSAFGSHIAWHLPKDHHPLVLDIQMDVGIVLFLIFVGGSHDAVTGEDHAGGLDLTGLGERQRSPVFVELP